MERGVEAGHGRQVGQDGADRLEGGERLGLVERREVGEVAQPGDDVRVEPDGAGEARAAVDDPVADGVDGAERPDRAGHG